MLNSGFYNLFYELFLTQIELRPDSYRDWDLRYTIFKMA